VDLNDIINLNVLKDGDDVVIENQVLEEMANEKKEDSAKKNGFERNA
jgi:hypothetical protein